MNKKITIGVLIFFVSIFLLYSEEDFGVLDPKTNKYSDQIETFLLENGYIKVSEEKFHRNLLFQEIYKFIYNEEYSKPLPDYCINNFKANGLYYIMLNSYEYKDKPPLMTYIVLQNGNEKFYYYKFNYALEYTVYNYQTRIDYEGKSIVETKTVLVFY